VFGPILVAGNERAIGSYKTAAMFEVLLECRFLSASRSRTRHADCCLRESGSMRNAGFIPMANSFRLLCAVCKSVPSMRTQGSFWSAPQAGHFTPRELLIGRGFQSPVEITQHKPQRYHSPTLISLLAIAPRLNASPISSPIVQTRLPSLVSIGGVARSAAKGLGTSFMKDCLPSGSTEPTSPR
jgi:hypothetical protein